MLASHHPSYFYLCYKARSFRPSCLFYKSRFQHSENLHLQTAVVFATFSQISSITASRTQCQAGSSHRSTCESSSNLHNDANLPDLFAQHPGALVLSFTGTKTNKLQWCQVSSTYISVVWYGDVVCTGARLHTETEGVKLPGLWTNFSFFSLKPNFWFYTIDFFKSIVCHVGLSSRKGSGRISAVEWQYYYDPIWNHQRSPVTVCVWMHRRWTCR